MFVEPNLDVSQVISNEEARISELISTKIKVIEDIFMTINDETEREISNSSQVVDERLSIIDDALLRLLDDQNLVSPIIKIFSTTGKKKCIKINKKTVFLLLFINFS